MPSLMKTALWGSLFGGFCCPFFEFKEARSPEHLFTNFYAANKCATIFYSMLFENENYKQGANTFFFVLATYAVAKMTYNRFFRYVPM
ncbi:MAG: hypothetical protein K1000chlam3_01170 [Chlamydiae bacterium]|nr:hypothetical protein [Chlamydiota bacterium]